MQILYSSYSALLCSRTSDSYRLNPNDNLENTWLDTQSLPITVRKMDIVIDNSLFTVKIGGSGDRHDHWILITTKTITPMAAPRTNRPFTTGFHLKPLPPGNAFLPFQSMSIGYSSCTSLALYFSDKYDVQFYSAGLPSTSCLFYFWLSIIPLDFNFQPKSYTNSLFLRLNQRLFWAYLILTSLVSCRHPQLGYSLYIKLIVARMRVLTFQAEVHVYWWQLVNEVQTGRLTSNRPVGVQKMSLGAAKGQF